MAEILEKINELRELSEDTHLFCPRVGEDGALYYPEDVASRPPETDPAELEDRKQKIADAEERKWTALKAAEILAYDGEEAAPHKEWLLSRLNGIMQSCDVCVRVFHQSRPEWKTRLVESYDEENIDSFLKLVDEHCVERITKGLDEAKEVLSAAEPKARSVRILPEQSTYAVFEALGCDAWLRNEELLRNHFDVPFDLVQTKKRLKLQTFLPAMTRFLFGTNEKRQYWATQSWATASRNLLRIEFDWAVRDHLVDVMMKVQMNNLDLTYVPIFWAGVRLIVNKMDRELIQDSLRGLDGGFYRLMLDHLSLKCEGLLDILDTMQQLIDKAPTDFWDGMNAITPSIATVAEQVFNSPVFNHLLMSASDESKQDMENLHAAFSWITPFLGSIKTAHLGPAIRPFATALFERFQSDRYSKASRAYCYKEGMKVLVYAFRTMSETRSSEEFVGQPAVNGMLDLLSTHIESLVTSLKRFNSSKENAEELQLALSVIQHAFQLEAKSLVIERNLISAQQPSPTETPPSSPIWRTILRAIDSESLELATHLLIAGRSLIGLEPLQMKAGVEKVPPTVRHFNDRFAMLSQSITDVVDRLSEFDPPRLQALFEKPVAASAIISLLFSSTEDTRSSAVELLKVISSEDERRDALQYILRAHYKNAVVGISDSIRMIKQKRPFAPAPSMIRTCSDIIDVMCNSQDGILRSRNLEPGEPGATMNFWKNLWESLTMIFATTEAWSNLGFYSKTLMMDFCRDVMQFADQLFNQCSIFATALKGASSESPDEQGPSKTEYVKELLALPTDAMDGLAKWLRLRDEFLSHKSVTLISKLLVRLHSVHIEVDADALSYMEKVLSGEVRAKLSTTQQAELQQALETHLGRSLVKEEEEVKPKQASLNKWVSTGATPADRPTPADTKAKLMATMTSGANAFKERRDASRLAESRAVKAKDEADKKAAQQDDFRKKRQIELQKREKEKAAAIAKARQARGLTGEAGSGLEGLGVLGKDQAAKGEGLMHSSDESNDEDGDIDEDLFGIQRTKPRQGPTTNIVNEVKTQAPVKKKRIQRSVKDMRARLAPDLSSLHSTILGWDYFHEGDFPPKSRPDMYSKVLSTFRTPNEYQATFEPLLTLEAWQGFVKAREENTARPYEVRVTSRASVDAFQEVGSTMTHQENRDIMVSEGDIILLSKTQKPSAQDKTCLARVFRVKRKAQHIEVSYRVIPGNPLSSSLNPSGSVFGTKLQSITPLEREYGALKGLQYYDLCDEIIRAKPSPMLSYRDNQFSILMSHYQVNKAQARAIKSAIDNDAFTLIQGPPGSGKTKTITAIVGALLSDNFRKRTDMPSRPVADAMPKKILVCAPSNAAVDELVMRFKGGVKTLNGADHQLNIVRLGRSDAINANVQDVTLEELVNKKMGVGAEKGADQAATKKLFSDHKQVSEQLRQARDQRDSGLVKGDDLTNLQNEINAMAKQKALLGTKIDNTKDDEKRAMRDNDVMRRRAQESVLNSAHVICATLSGSGHEMFQGINIEFETVIVDEAAQCVEMSALIPLKYGCAKCILVGDPKQLPPTVFSKEAARFQYEQSLFVRMQTNHPNDVHLLDTQYRMHPEISLFPSRTFYDSRLLDGDDMAGLRKRPWHSSLLLGPYRFYDVQGQHQAAPKGHSLINNAEINVAMQLYARVTSDFPDYDFRGKIGIITPYKSQLRELKSRFSAQYGQSILEAVEFNTTDAFQGRESEIIIFSCVRASPSGGIGFLQDIRRMNVGLTRAKSSLWVLGNSQSLVRGEFWRKLIEDAKARKRYTEGDVTRMLKQHSSKFPAPREGYLAPHRPDSTASDLTTKIKQEASHNVNVKHEAKQDVSPDLQPKSEPGSRRSSSAHSVSMKDGAQWSDGKAVKQETPNEHTLTLPLDNRKRRAADDLERAASNGTDAGLGNGHGDGSRSVKVKVDTSDHSTPGNTPDPVQLSTNGSDRSTPAPLLSSSAATSRNHTPDPAAAGGPPTAPGTARDLGAAMGNAKPRIRKKPREPADPFIRRPNKKARMG